ncbi:MAG: hypothetical protein LBQ84_06970, partial [Flavobacteriaceae bacterium]|nr:hypothetical protein [Flavobacteriaceae bacterium]
MKKYYITVLLFFVFYNMGFTQGTELVEFIDPINKSTTSFTRSSDYGPRNPKESGSSFHCGQDYGLTSKDVKRAYAVEGGDIEEINFKPDDNEKNARIIIKNWYYMHMAIPKNMIDPDFNPKYLHVSYENSSSHQVFSVVVINDNKNDDNEIIDGRTLISTQNYRDLHKGKITSLQISNEETLGTNNETLDTLVHKFVYTVAKKEWIFSPQKISSMYHLHLQHGRRGESENPLKWIPYKNKEKPRVYFEFQKNYENKRADLFSNQHIIYGSVILQTKVDVTNPYGQSYADADADLYKVSVAIPKLLQRPIKEYEYIGTKQTKHTIVKKKTEAEIHSSIEEGIYPVMELVSIDYFKEKWNTTDGEIGTPKYPDGKYDMQIIAEDIKSGKTPKDHSFILDNNYPYIKKVEIVDERGNQVDKWDSNNNLKLNGGNIKVKVTTSEPMSNLLLQGKQMYSLSEDITNWAVITHIEPVCNEMQILEFSGYDLAGNALLDTGDPNFNTNTIRINRNDDGKIISNPAIGDKKYKLSICPSVKIKGETDFNPCDSGKKDEIKLTIEISGAGDCMTNSKILWNDKETNKIEQTVDSIGTYKVEVKFSNGCEIRDEVTITEAGKNKLDVVIFGDDVILADCKGQLLQENHITLKAIVKNGGNNFTYLWKNGNDSIDNKESIIVSKDGIYSVFVTSDTGCTGSTTKKITKQESNLSIDIQSRGELVSYCGTASPIILEAFPSNGTEPYTYSWMKISKDTTLIGKDKTIEISEDGNYVVTATDKNGCTNTSQKFQVEMRNEENLKVEITAPPYITLNCKREATAKANLTAIVKGGSGKYIYMWDGKTISNVLSTGEDGIHYINVRDTVNNCTGYAKCTIESKVENPLKVYLYSTERELHRDCGEDPFPVTIGAFVGSGSGDYSYSWSVSSAWHGSSSNFIEVNSPGEYSVIVTDNKTGCTTSESIRIDGTVVNCPIDPNEIAGPTGYAESQWVSQKDRMNYTIRYENDP